MSLVASARADAPSGAVLRFEAPIECPGEGELRHEVETLIRRSWGDIEGTLEIEARISRDERGWALVLRSGAGERAIHSEHCEALVQTAAVLIAWMIDPDAAGIEAALEVEEPAPEVTPAQPAIEPAPELVEHSVPVHTPGAPPPGPEALPTLEDPARSLGDPSLPPIAGSPLPLLAIGALLLVDYGTGPAVTAGVLGEVIVRIDRLDLRGRGGWLAPAEVRLANSAAPDGAGLALEWAGGSVHGCGRAIDPAGLMPGIALCGGVHGGAFLARGLAISSPGESVAPFAALGGMISMPWIVLPVLDLELSAELLVMLSTPTFSLEPFGAVYATAPVAGRLTVGAHFDVP